jgi:hypothetical protein
MLMANEINGIFPDELYTAKIIWDSLSGSHIG